MAEGPGKDDRAMAGASHPGAEDRLRRAARALAGGDVLTPGTGVGAGKVTRASDPLSRRGAAGPVVGEVVAADHRARVLRGGPGQLEVGTERAQAVAAPRRV